ncbi:MAG: GDSL-type esterase/lipase family protein [Limisphaerales bacterium]
MKLSIALAAISLAIAADSLAQVNRPPAIARGRHHFNQPANPQLPSLFIIGDSTVRNGEGIGTGGQWGWGDYLAPYFETNKINVVNRALGGTSSRTFYRDQWPAVRAMLKPGDFVIMQFGHNDSSPINDMKRARGTIKGVGEQTQEINNLLTKQKEIVHTFGWYESHMITDARARGAVPMVCSLIPRNIWRNGRVVRNKGDYAGWAEEVAASGHAPFLDINEIIARDYDTLGWKKVQPLFVPGAGPHTSLAGAETNAMCVVAALKGLKVNPLAPYFSEKAKAVAPAGLNPASPTPTTAKDNP